MKEGLSGLPANFLVMVTSSPDNYVQVMLSVLRNLVTPRSVGVYISVNKPYFSVAQIMNNQKISTEHMYFLDCASGLMGKPPQELEKAYILSGPHSLTELNITLSKLLSSEKVKGKENDTILFLDSVSTFLLYNDQSTVAKFLHTIAGKVRTHNIRGVFFSLQQDAASGAVASTTQFHDKVLHVA